MVVAIYKAVGRARFPRWNFLDKFETMEFLPRALLSAVALHFVAIGAYRGYDVFQGYLDEFRVESSVTKTARIINIAEIQPPPSILRNQHPTSVVRVKPKTHPRSRAQVVPVQDELAAPAAITSWDETSSQNGVHDPNGLVDGNEFLFENGFAPLPKPDDYVAYEKAPVLVRMDAPQYPALARDAGVQGKVLVRVLVGADGFVRDLVVIQSVSMLDEAAQTAVKTAVFKPAVQKDRPVAAWVVIPIDFRLQG